jgi:serine/threonine protein phosphatase 1
MSRRTIAIGDIHGCAPALETLLDAVQPAADDRIVTLGDYVDRGPDSRGVIERLIRLQQQCRLVPLLGNHELMLLAARDAEEELALWLTCGGRETLLSYGGSLQSIPDGHIAFLNRCVPYHETDTHIYVHANYHADASLKDQTEYVLFWKHLSTEFPRPHESGKIAIVGHTPQPNGLVLDAGHVICIDTCCFGCGWLTALDVDGRRIWQANNQGKLREDQLADPPPTSMNPG